MTQVVTFGNCDIIRELFSHVVVTLEPFTVFATTYGANGAGIVSSGTTVTFLNFGVLGIVLTHSDMYAIVVRRPLAEAVSGSESCVSDGILCTAEVITVCGLGAVIGAGSVAIVYVIGEGMLELFAIVHTAIITGLRLGAGSCAAYVSASKYGVANA